MKDAGAKARLLDTAVRAAEICASDGLSNGALCPPDAIADRLRFFRAAVATLLADLDRIRADLDPKQVGPAWRQRLADLSHFDYEQAIADERESAERAGMT